MWSASALGFLPEICHQLDFLEMTSDITELLGRNPSLEHRRYLENLPGFSRFQNFILQLRLLAVSHLSGDE